MGQRETMNFNRNTEWPQREENPDRGYSIDDELFAIALAIPALFAAERYVDTEREKTTLARLQEMRRTAVVKAATREIWRTHQTPLA
jgi:N-acetylglucosamine kinase-like BadF-type ATPase